MRKIAIGSDHAGYQHKEKISSWLRNNQIDVLDFGVFSEDPVDYPDVVHPLCNCIENDEKVSGILLCGSGNGVAMTANKHPYIRAALCWNVEIAILAKKHNDANVICLPARFINFETAIDIIIAYFKTEFEGGRHSNRIKKIPLA